MIKSILKRKLKPLRMLVGRFIILPDYIIQTPISAAADFAYAELIEGDYLEFGVFKGASFIEAFEKIEYSRKKWDLNELSGNAFSNNKSSLNIKKLPKKRFFAFDSFEGLPSLEKKDAGSARFEKGRYDCSEEAFLKNLSINGVDINRVTTIPGYYDKSLIQEVKVNHSIKKAAIIMIDCDIYSSTKSVLNFITDLIDDGTILIFDDWFCHKGNPNYGEQKACNEWLSKNKHIQLTPYMQRGTAQKSFIVNIKK
jgi:O-methyltransferase